MISVILYGRNDAHGYNLHRRAALSLNCIAEVLTDPDDEIVFVDYNTPDELPTFVEALADTLTDRCLSLLRVLRVPAAIHAERFASRTHLPAIEPIARNAGVRRANPANRWLLSTNTDMIFLPQGGPSLSEVCADLPDAFYGLPRFELPEWLWERLPRSDPRRAMSEIERLGPALRLNEPTFSTEWIRFDAPGDFQLVLREDFIAIDALDEEMLLGYHVDSNLSKRMLLLRGSIESLGEKLAGYHCNHNREPTIYHGAGKVANDLERFFVAVDSPDLPAQRETWGLVGETLEEVPVRERVGPHLIDALAAAIPDAGGDPEPSDAARIPYEVSYDSGHVLPFVADSLAVSASDATIGYVGANSVLERMLASVVQQLGFADALQVATFDDGSGLEAVARDSDVLVVDLGVDASDPDAALARFREHQPAELPAKLAGAIDGLEELVEIERKRLEGGEHPRRFVLVHSWTVFWDAYVVANFDCSHMTAHSRVRRATVRRAPAYDAATKAALARERLLRRWARRGDVSERRLRIPVREALRMGDLHDFGGFGEGWAFPEEAGIWTQGRRAELALEVNGNGDDDRVLALSLGSVCVERDGSLQVCALVGGERIAAREFRYGDPDWYVELPAGAAADGVVDVVFEIEDPRTPIDVGWSTADDRQLGILLRTIRALPVDDEAARAGLARERRIAAWAAREPDARLRIRPGDSIELADLDDYGGFRDGWVIYPDQHGIWTEGSRSELALVLDGLEGGDYFVSLSLGSVCVAPDQTLTVEAYINGERAVARRLRYGDSEWRIEAPRPAPPSGEVELALSIPEPRSPRELGWSKDDRPLGLLVRGLTVAELDPSVSQGEKIVFSEGSGADRLLGHGWSGLESTGVWTDGEEATLVLKLTPAPTADSELLLDVEPFLSPRHRELEVEVFARDQRLAARTFRHRRGARRLRLRHPPLRISLPPAVLGEDGRVVLELRVRNPVRPVDLGVSDDRRRLGLHLRSLTVRRV